jgi:hypothetical protein
VNSFIGPVANFPLCGMKVQSKHLKYFMFHFALCTMCFGFISGLIRENVVCKVKSIIKFSKQEMYCDPFFPSMVYFSFIHQDQLKFNDQDCEPLQLELSSDSVSQLLS